MKKILHSTSGETIAETLVSMLVVSMVFAFITTAVITSDRINKKARDEMVIVDLQKSVEDGDFNVSISLNGETDIVEAKQYKVSRNKAGDKYYYYYEIK